MQKLSEKAARAEMRSAMTLDQLADLERKKQNADKKKLKQKEKWKNLKKRSKESQSLLKNKYKRN